MVGGNIAVAAVVSGSCKEFGSSSLRHELPDACGKAVACPFHHPCIGNTGGIRELFELLHLFGCDK